MRKLVMLGLVGLIAQLVDGTLGMGYGLTSTSLLVAAGTAPAMASAVVHLAELGTTAASGVSHWRFGNVEWRTVRLMTFPGAVGAFAGAMALSWLGATAKPWVALVLLGLGVYLLVGFVGGRTPRSRRPLRAVVLGPLGFGAGFLDAAGGGGWGPVGTPTLLASGRLAPRQVIGSVAASEFLVALGASAGFLVSLRGQQLPIRLVLVLLAGGLVAAPLAAWLTRRLAARKLGVVVGAMILFTNTRTLAGWPMAVTVTAAALVAVTVARRPSACKRAVDLVGAVVGLAVLWPLLVVIGVAVELDSPGPAIFTQERVGRDGRRFRMWKFRTMVVGADALHPGGLLFKAADDPRLTRVGRWLRRASLDELPQLVNVLVGHMSLVGPRPALPREVAQYTATERARLAVLPGMTGLWQISGRSNLDYEDAVALDLHYVKRWSVGYDLAILGRTIPAVLTAKGAY